MMRSKKMPGSIHPLIMILVIGLAGCAKEPGIGGRGEIQGRVMEQHQGEGDFYPRPDHEVYIVYGDGTTEDDNVRTGPDGRFRFPWLRKGNYRIYTFSECEVNITDCPSGTVAVTRDVDLIERKDLVDVGDLNITNW